MKRTNDDVLVGRMPSMGERCPRCRQRMSTAQMDSGVMLESCREGHYEARTVTGESRLAWHEAVSSKIRIGRRLYR